MTMTDTFTPPTDKQLAFLNKLLDERPMLRDVENLWPENIAKLDRKMISSKIDEVLKTPKESGAKQTVSVELITEDGMYKDPESGEVFKVQIAHHGSGNLYAKRLVIFPQSDWYTKTVRGKEVEVRGEFTYAPGALRNLKPDWKMTLDEAKAFGQLYGVCCNCGATLTDETSIAAGIGPICAGRFS